MSADDLRFAPKATDAELRFMILREESRGQWGRPRCTGRSSDALARFGLGYGEKPTENNDYPHDGADLDACERTYAMAPTHVQAKMRPVLLAYRVYVYERLASYAREQLAAES